MARRRPSPLLLALALLAVALAAAGCGDAGAGQVVEVHLATRQFALEPAEVRVHRGDRVRLVVTSSDVTHGFAIAEYQINRQTPPGQSVVIEFTADRPGRFPIYCTVFCGTGHADHRGVLIVE